MTLNAGTKNQLIKQSMFFEMKIQEHHDKNDSKNRVFVHLRCSLTFGRSLGSPKEALDVSEVDFDPIWRDLGAAPGKILECFGRGLVPKRTPGSIWP